MLMLSNALDYCFSKEIIVNMILLLIKIDGSWAYLNVYPFTNVICITFILIINNLKVN